MPASSSAHEPFPANCQKTVPTRRKWNEDYINYKYFRPKDEEKNVIHQPSVCFA